MARKNIFDLEPDEALLAGANEPTPIAPVEPKGRPLQGLNLDGANRPSALGAISKSLERINERSAKADEIEKQLASGQTVVELDTDLIESSFVSDRLGFDDADQATLVDQIRDMGQMVPILVRPHPDAADRFQVAYGHRRLAATRALGRPVKAIVRKLTDEELVIHQGQENNSRSNLSFIEKAFFAYTLEQRGYSRETLNRSTGIDKTILSKMISFVKAIPEEVIRKIGRAPSIGRKRWEAFVGLLDKSGARIAQDAVKHAGFEQMNSDDRFEYVLLQLKAARESAAKKPDEMIRPRFGAGVQPLTIQRTGTKTVMTFDDRHAPEFADFVQTNLDRLFDEYEAGRRKSG